VRLDKLLWFLRLARTRTRAQAWIAEGHIRRNGQRVERQDLPVTTGDVLTLPIAKQVMVIELLVLPTRRGPAAEAQSCYRVLDGSGLAALAGGEPQGPERKTLQ
jgi:ribosome-associated heat shock protein Hsp15